MENATSKKIEQIKKTTAKLLLQIEQLEAINNKTKFSNNDKLHSNAFMNESTINRMITRVDKLKEVDLIK
tara:strand:- start:375 stop:584 length:210 start_codon:yes stop_codon:yes gene_type:complete